MIFKQKKVFGLDDEFEYGWAGARRFRNIDGVRHYRNENLKPFNSGILLVPGHVSCRMDDSFNVFFRWAPIPWYETE